MSYVSLIFLVFFTVVACLYYLLPLGRHRFLIILAANMVFCYFAGGLSTLILMVYLAAVTTVSARCIGKVYLDFDENKAGLSVKEQYRLLEQYKHKALRFLIIGLSLIAIAFFYVKIGRLLRLEPAGTIYNIIGYDDSGSIIWKVFIPIGLSFYTLSLLGYILDVYWRKTVPVNNFLKVFTCISFFPTVIEGPIVRLSNLMDQISNPVSFRYDHVTMGLQLMMWGFFKKLIIAEGFLLIQNEVFGNITQYRGFTVIVATFANVIVDYADFSGCIDIARGSAQVLGIELPENFRQPFFSKSASEFWRRWHITLGEWFKEYIYMPLARSPRFIKLVGKVRKQFNKRAGKIFSTGVPLLLVWLLTGFWHGTGKDYLFWGLYWGNIILFSMICEPVFVNIKKLLKIRDSTFSYECFQMARTFMLFAVGRMITATGSLRGFLRTLKQLAAEFNPWVFFDGSLFKLGLGEKDFRVGVYAVLIMWIADLLSSRFCVREKLKEEPLIVRWMIFGVGILMIVIFGMYGPAYNPSSFMYGNF